MDNLNHPDDIGCESKKCLFNVRLLPSPKYASSCSWCNVEWSTFFQCDQLKGINFTTTLNTMKFCSFLASTWENIPFIIRVKFHISYLFVYVILVQLSRCLWLTFKHEHFLNMELNMHIQQFVLKEDLICCRCSSSIKSIKQCWTKLPIIWITQYVT